MARGRGGGGGGGQTGISWQMPESTPSSPVHPGDSGPRACHMSPTSLHSSSPSIACVPAVYSFGLFHNGSAAHYRRPVYRYIAEVAALCLILAGSGHLYEDAKLPATIRRPAGVFLSCHPSLIHNPDLGVHRPRRDHAIHGRLRDPEWTGVFSRSTTFARIRG